jgi:Na+-driven multidrug efflux pump
MTPLALGLGEALAAITESEATGDGAAHYLQVRMLGFPFEVCSFVVLGILRAGYRAVWTPLVVMLVALTANAGLNALFVWGFGWGLTGIALASAIAPALAVGCAAVPISRWGGWAIGAGLGAVRRLKLAPMTMLSLQLGGIAVWRGILLNGVLIGSSVVAERFSTNALAAHGLALQLWLLIAFAIDGFSHAGLAYGSRLLGAGEFDRARAFAWRLIGASFGLCAIICGLLIAVWSALPGVFGLDAIAAAAFIALLTPLCIQVLPSSVAFVADGILKGAGDIAFLARQMLLASAVVFPLALFFLGDSLTGLWWAVTLWLVARATLSALRLAGSRWQKIAAEQLE